MLEELGITENQKKPFFSVSSQTEAGKICAALSGNRLSVAELQKRTGLEFSVLTKVLLSLVLDGNVVENPPGWYELGENKK